MARSHETIATRSRRWLWVLGLLAPALASSCQSGRVSTLDAGADAGLDGGPSGPDSGLDAGSTSDAGDAGADAGQTMPPGDGGDAGFDGGTAFDGGPGFDAGPPNACLPFSMPSADTLFASNRKVFGHYFYPFPLSIDNNPPDVDYYNRNYLLQAGEHGAHWDAGGYLRSRPLGVADSGSPNWQVENQEKEIRMAMAAGITGFTVDVLGPNQWDAGTQLQNLLLAATAVDSRFKIVVMPDLSALGPDAGVVDAIIESVASSPAAYHLPDGRLVVTSFDASLGSIAFWNQVFNDVSDAGIRVAFIPTFLGGTGSYDDFEPISYGLSSWGTATPVSSASEVTEPLQAHDAGEISMLPVDPQQYRPKDLSYWEAGNSAAFRTSWQAAIDGGADWVQLVTWSDFSESSQVEPATDLTLATDIGTGFYDLNAYYAAWFLTGQAPTLTHDVIYYFYRREPTNAASPAQAAPTHLAVGGGTTVDNIELVGALTAPGTLQITINGQTFTQDVPAGLTSFTIPLQPGRPQFALRRDGGEVISFEGGIDIVDAGGLDSGVADFTYWSGSASEAGVCNLIVP